MNTEDLQFNVKYSAQVLESTGDQFNHAVTEKKSEIKSRELCGIIGELSSALAHLHDTMELELKNRQTKKFWQFWK